MALKCSTYAYRIYHNEQNARKIANKMKQKPTGNHGNYKNSFFADYLYVWNSALLPEIRESQNLGEQRVTARSKKQRKNANRKKKIYMKINKKK